MTGPTPAAALRGVATATGAASGLVPEPLRWIPTAATACLLMAADLLEEGPGWGHDQRQVVRLRLEDALDALPEVRPTEAADMARGVVAAVSVVRRWIAP